MKHFKSDEKNVKNLKKRVFSVFFIIERVFVKGIHRKIKKVKLVFASFLIRNYTFSKKYEIIKNTNTIHHENHDFFKNKSVLHCKNALTTIQEFLLFPVFR